MEKVILFLSIILVSIFSCSKDEEANSDAAVLPKRIVSMGEDASPEIFLSYNGNKITETSSIRNNVARKSIYTYNSDLIVKSEDFKNGVLSSLEEFQYDGSSKLKTVFFTEYGTQVYKSKREYTTNADGTILEVNYDFLNNAYVEDERTNTYTLANGNITKLYQKYTSVSPNPVGGTTSSLLTESTYTYEYDDKKGPAKNIIGLNQIYFDENFCANNVTKKTSSIKETRTENNVLFSEIVRTNVRVFTLSYATNGYLSETKYTYETNENNVPVTKTESSQYFYE